MQFHFAVDRGGTFTDVYARYYKEDGTENFKIVKLLSEDPELYQDAPREGIRRILEEITGMKHCKHKPLDTSCIKSIRMGTTVATNALLERSGERCALVITKGFKDLLYIGNQSRPDIFNLNIDKPEMLYEYVLEIDERVQVIQDVELIHCKDSTSSWVKGLTGDYIEVLREPDYDAIKEELRKIRNEKNINSVAIVLMHAYSFTDHEQKIASIATDLGFAQVSTSFEVMPMVKIVPRGYTTCTEAYLSPVLKTYLKSFKLGFDQGFSNLDISFMQSDGGLTGIDTFYGHRAILSGPAGGVVGYAKTTPIPKACNGVIGFDMGGTSTDVSRYDGLEYEHVYEAVTSGIPIQAPQLHIETIAAGGGSRLFFRNGLLVVGPESAGADPGPICYRKVGGMLAITDANLALGRIVPQLFPHIFGPDGNLPLDLERTTKEFEKLKCEINESSANLSYTTDELAYGFLRVANEAMCRPIRNLTQMKGFDMSKHVLACFGGAGPQHACAIAKSLGMTTVYIHRFSGVLSAYGLTLAEKVVDRQKPSSKFLTQATELYFQEQLQNLGSEVQVALSNQGFQQDAQVLHYFLNMRYEGTDVAVMVMSSHPSANFGSLFKVRYEREFGFSLHGRSIIVDDIRVRGSGQSYLPPSDECSLTETSTSTPSPELFSSVYFEGVGRIRTPVYSVNKMSGNERVSGPCLMLQDTATILVEPNCEAVVASNGDIVITLHQTASLTKSISTINSDAVLLSIFAHRFMSIAEQMGKILQRTAVSVNIKERLDFSCAIFSPDGGLVANAPHLPVHLGSMQQAVRFQLQHWKGDLHRGDVLLSNHPQLAGGSHLPDITVITPVFGENDEIIFFVANRGHHSDVGGITPGSMPPHSKTLTDEGAAIIAFKVVSGASGSFNQDELSKLLLAPGDLANNSGTRTLNDNISDIKAQVAANTRGAALLNELVETYTLQVVHAYMMFIQENAEMAVRSMLYAFSENRGLLPVGYVRSEDYMDDGSKIALQLTIDRNDRSAIFDFSGTSEEIMGNTNCPPSVSYSAVVYCLRCLLSSHDIPLNQGCLTPIKIILPEASLLNPSPNAAVVGGNVLTSQRITDVILKAFEACADSQGCMNNLSLGDSKMGYYETIAGGAGAGPTWSGASCVHTHMTNTRITDPEILERRYPVLLHEFSRRVESGGAGLQVGGDGTIREFKFLRPLTVSILSERRVFRPNGMHGGCPGLPGKNLYKPSTCSFFKNLGGKATIHVAAGDILRILTPGGGGYGKPAPP